ncbi:MAG: MazG family protein [Oscillospiraceae bacterium]|jgi:tetrapyrrole methylase family protein/MazG family protein|nr:MazG family protein [Oscillospiraceae bacterium]
MLDIEGKLSATTDGKYDFDALVAIIALLRGEDGCPWDKEQTHKSIRNNLIEEAFELAEALDEDSAQHMREELGDVLLQVVFHSDIERERGRFTVTDVTDAVVRKLLFRHPHVFGSVQAETSAEVLTNWDVLKAEEKGQDTLHDAVSAVSKTLPATWRAEKILKKAWKSDTCAAEGLVAALKREAGTPQERLSSEVYGLILEARRAGLDFEAAIDAANERAVALTGGAPFGQRTGQS